MSKTKELDRIVNNVHDQTIEYMNETISKELEYSDINDVNELHEYVMNKVAKKMLANF